MVYTGLKAIVLDLTLIAACGWLVITIIIS